MKAITKKLYTKSSRKKDPRQPRKWESDEDDRLKEAVGRHGERRWKSIACHVRTRNHVQCLQRWKKVQKPGLVKGKWSAREDETLIELKQKNATCNWGKIAANIDGRTSKQCRERWRHHLDPAIIKDKTFTTKEDADILKLQEELGNRWSKLALRLPGRTETDIKVRWHALQKKVEFGSGRRSGSQSVPTSSGPAGTFAEGALTTSSRSDLVCWSPASIASGSPSSLELDMVRSASERWLLKGPVAPAPAPRPPHLCPGTSSYRELDFSDRQCRPWPLVVPAFHGGGALPSTNVPETPAITTNQRGDSGRAEEPLSLQSSRFAGLLLSNPTPIECLSLNPIGSGGSPSGNVGMFGEIIAPGEASADPLPLPPATAPGPTTTAQNQRELQWDTFDFDLGLEKAVEDEEGASECAFDGTDTTTMRTASFEEYHAPGVEGHSVRSAPNLSMRASLNRDCS